MANNNGSEAGNNGTILPTWTNLLWADQQASEQGKALVKVILETPKPTYDQVNQKISDWEDLSIDDKIVLLETLFLLDKEFEYLDYSWISKIVSRIWNGEIPQPATQLIKKILSGLSEDGNEKDSQDLLSEYNISAYEFDHYFNMMYGKIFLEIMKKNNFSSNKYRLCSNKLSELQQKYGQNNNNNIYKEMIIFIKRVSTLSEKFVEEFNENSDLFTVK